MTHYKRNPIACKIGTKSILVRAQPILKCRSILSSYSKVVVLCEAFEAQHLGCQAHKVLKESKQQQGMYFYQFLCFIYSPCHASQEITLKKKFACIQRKHRFKVIRVACTLRKCQNAQNPSVVSEPRIVFCILDAKLLENRKFCSLSTGLAEFMGRTRRVHVQIHPTRRVGSCTRRVGACWAVFSCFVAGNGLKSLSQSVLDL